MKATITINRHGAGTIEYTRKGELTGLKAFRNIHEGNESVSELLQAEEITPAEAEEMQSRLRAYKAPAETPNNETRGLSLVLGGIIVAPTSDEIRRLG